MSAHQALHGFTTLPDERIAAPQVRVGAIEEATFDDAARHSMQVLAAAFACRNATRLAERVGSLLPS
ncbi:hypothetical protein ACWEHA_06125 [Amycolatopsis nivea]